MEVKKSIAFGALLQLKRLGYDIPRDIVVFSYGDVEAAKLLHLEETNCQKVSFYRTKLPL